VLTQRKPAKDRHHNQPAIRELIVAHHRVAIRAVRASAIEAAEDVVRPDWPVQHFAGRIELTSPLRVDRHARVDDLHDVVRAHRERIVGGVAEVRVPLRADEVCAEAIEARDEGGMGARSVRRLLDGDSTPRAGYARPRRDQACFHEARRVLRQQWQRDVVPHCVSLDHLK
jgi:hypothetical protein